MRTASAAALVLGLLASVALVSAQEVNVPALTAALKFKLSKASAYLVYAQQANLALSTPPQVGVPNTVLMPTDYAWYAFFLDYQRGSEFIRDVEGVVRFRFSADISQYTPKEFKDLMIGMITYQPNFARFCVKLMNHMTLPGNITVASLQKKKKDDLLPNQSDYPIYIVKTHPPTLKAVPSIFDDAQFSLRREVDPMYIPRIVTRTTSIIEQRVYHGRHLVVHLVDNVLPFIDTKYIDPPYPPPPAGSSPRTAALTVFSLVVAALSALFLARF